MHFFLSSFNDQPEAKACDPHRDPLMVFRQQQQRLIRHQELQPMELLLHAHPLFNLSKLKHTHTHTGTATADFNVLLQVKVPLSWFRSKLFD